MGVLINVDEDDAAVHFDFLSRSVGEQKGQYLERAVDHGGELWALNELLTSLEKSLTLSLERDYKQDVERARKTLVKRFGNWSEP